MNRTAKLPYPLPSLSTDAYPRVKLFSHSSQALTNLNETSSQLLQALRSSGPSTSKRLRECTYKTARIRRKRRHLHFSRVLKRIKCIVFSLVSIKRQERFASWSWKDRPTCHKHPTKVSSDLVLRSRVAHFLFFWKQEKTYLLSGNRKQVHQLHLTWSY